MRVAEPLSSHPARGLCDYVTLDAVAAAELCTPLLPGVMMMLLVVVVEVMSH